MVREGIARMRKLDEGRLAAYPLGSPPSLRDRGAPSPYIKPSLFYRAWRAGPHQRVPWRAASARARTRPRRRRHPPSSSVDTPPRPAPHGLCTQAWSRSASSGPPRQPARTQARPATAAVQRPHGKRQLPPGSDRFFKPCRARGSRRRGASCRTLQESLRCMAHYRGCTPPISSPLRIGTSSHISHITILGLYSRPALSPLWTGLSPRRAGPHQTIPAATSARVHVRKDLLTGDAASPRPAPHGR